MKRGKYIIYSFLLGLFFMAVPSLVLAANKQFTVVIDAGHGGKDPGAVDKTKKVLEKTINLNVALMLGEMITKNHPDVKVVYTRKTDVFIELHERANIANRAKADLFISIHTNAAKDRSARGTETYVLGNGGAKENLEVAMRENSAILYEDNYKERYEGFDPNSTESYIIFEFMQNKHLEQSINVASYIQKEFALTAKRSDRSVRQSNLFLVLRRTSMPSVLVELGYISNPDEEKYLSSAANQKILADCIYKGFVKMKQAYDKRNQNPAPSSTPPPVVEDKKENKKIEDKKIEDKKIEDKKDDKKETAAPISAETKNSAETVVYKVQIFATDKKVALDDKRLKNYNKVSFYEEKGLYKYTVGESTSLDEIEKIRKQLLPDFKDAFVVRFVNGARQK